MNSKPQLPIQLGGDPAVGVQVQALAWREIRDAFGVFWFLKFGGKIFKEMATTKHIKCVVSWSEGTDDDIIESFEQKKLQETDILYPHMP